MRRLLTRITIPVTAGKLNLTVMSAAFGIFGLSMVLQPHRWASTPAYHVLLQVFTAQAWGALFLTSSAALAAAAWQYRRRHAVIIALTAAFMLTTGWMLAFIVRYLTSPNTTPETWVSWAVFDILLLKVAASLDLPRETTPRPVQIGTYRQAVDDALTRAADNQRAAVSRALDTGQDKLSDTVGAACAAYAQALHAIVPAGAMPAGDPARLALDEARNALLRAEEAFTRATGTAAEDQAPGPPP